MPPAFPRNSHPIVFLTHFSEISDPWQEIKLVYPLPEILLLTLCAVLSGADGWVAISIYGSRKLAFLRSFLPFSDGTPSHDQLGNIFAALDAKAFQACFMDWVSEAVARYHTNAISTVEVLQELINLARDIREARGRGDEEGLSADEIAFYDALAGNESVIDVMGNDSLKLSPMNCSSD